VLSTDSNTIQLLEKTNGPTTSLSILTSLRTTFATAPSNNAGPALTFDLKVGASNAILGYINTVRWNNNAGGLMQLATNANGVIEPKLNIFPNGNILIQTGGVTTDAGFKLDVNGTARVRGQVSVVNGANTLSMNSGTYSFLAHNTVSVLSFNAGTELYINAGDVFCNTVNNFRLAGGLIVGNAGNRPASAILEIRSTTKGFLPPRMTTTEKNAIATPVAGLMVYDTTLNLISVFNGTIWI
jgi:hypothetical protein